MMSAIHVGDVQIVGMEFPLYELENGMRLFSVKGFNKAFTGRSRRSDKLTFKHLLRFRDDLSIILTHPYKFNYYGKMMYGYETDTLTRLCEVIIYTHEIGCLYDAKMLNSAKAYMQYCLYEGMKAVNCQHKEFKNE
jgi:hypothetical protein